MKYIASIDVGTTNVKGALIMRNGSIQASCEVEIETFYENDWVEQNPEQWRKALIEITKTWQQAGFNLKDIEMITFCGQMQDVIPIDESGAPVRNAILYSDARAEEQAESMLTVDEKIRKLTGNEVNATTPFAKIKWLQEHEEESFARTTAFLFSSKDFLISQLTGEHVTDVTTAATTGMMDIDKRAWMTDEIVNEGIAADLVPLLGASDDIAGYVSAFASRQTGFMEGTPVLYGIGDAGATTLGAGVVTSGDRYIYAGTTGWIATTMTHVGRRYDGLFHLAHLSQEFIKVIPLTNVGSVHEWAVQTFCNKHADKADAYRELDQQVNAVCPDENGVLFLPYLNSERFPVRVSHAAGSFLRLNSSTTSSQMARAVLEGIAFSIRQSMETLTAPQDKPITLLGGGSRSMAWTQILADVCQQELHIPENAENLPILGAASSAFVRLGWCRTYQEFTDDIVKSMPKRRVTPNRKEQKTYDTLYEDFKRIYPAVKDI